MDAASQHFPGSSQRITISLKLNTSCEDWGNCQVRGAKKYRFTAFYAIRLGAPLHYNVREIPLSHSYQLLCFISYCYWASLQCLSSRIGLDLPNHPLDLSAAFDTAHDNALLEILFSLGFRNTIPTWVSTTSQSPLLFLLPFTTTKILESPSATSLAFLLFSIYIHLCALNSTSLKELDIIWISSLRMSQQITTNWWFAPISASILAWPSLCPSQIPLSSPTKTLVIGFRKRHKSRNISSQDS